MMVVPLPAAVLDVLIAGNIAMALLVLLVAMQVRKPLEFAVFPTVVLVGTILRLALNVVEHPAGAPRRLRRPRHRRFGHIVIGGSLVIGLVVFAILVVIQLTVVTNGAARVAEVGARFTLDAMPGKQMAIDADLNSGLIDEDEARRRRKEVAAEADFYGAMDGGTKFVKGDAMAAVIITVVNLVGGLRRRHAPEGHVARRRDQHLLPADRRRRPRLAGPRAAHVRRDRRHRDPVDLATATSATTWSASSPGTARRCGSAAPP